MLFVLLLPHSPSDKLHVTWVVYFSLQQNIAWYKERTCKQLLSEWMNEGPLNELRPVLDDSDLVPPFLVLIV